MIKSFHHYNIQLTPFQAVKNWELNNTQNEELLLFESTGSDDGEPLDFEYIDFGNGITTPYTSSECELALEQQSADMVHYREGQSLTGPFYPDTDPVNVDGTYKRSVYSQVKTSFYNTYRDPTKLFGMENIDFEQGKTKRRLAAKLRMFDIPRNVFGDKIVPNTVVIYDTSLDNDYTIEDDGYGNLTARRNLFSKQQEIGDFINCFDPTSNNPICDTYLMFLPEPVPPPPSVPLNLSSSIQSGIQVSLSWSMSTGSVDSYTLQRSLTPSGYSTIASGLTNTNYLDTSVSSGTTYYYVVYAVNTYGTSSNSNNVDATLPTILPLIPNMTGFTTPSGVVTETNHAGFQAGWTAMDGIPASLYWFSVSNVPVYLGYQFTTNKTVTSYVLRGFGVGMTAYNPKDWVFQGSNDGSNWTDLDVETNIQLTIFLSTFNISSPASYLYYRIYITGVWGGGTTNTGLVVFQLYGY